MNILILIHEYPPVGGGGGLIARDLAISLAKRGHRILIVTSHFQGLPNRVTVDGIEIVRLEVNRKEAFRAGFETMLKFVVAASFYTIFQLKDFKADLIHAHFAVPAGAAAFASSIVKRIPYILTVHLGDIPGASPEKTGKWFKRVYPLTKIIWNKAAYIIAVSEFSRSLSLQSYPVDIEVIPNGISREIVFPNLPIEVNDPVRIVFAGRFVPQKNLKQIINSLEKIKDLNWRCRLIGDGAEREVIESLIREKGLKEKIDLPGWLAPEEVTEAFRNSDILFLPSLTEGLPIVGIQAMASGLAMVVSNAGGNPELVESGKNGFTFDPHDTDGFASALRKLIEEKELLNQFREASYEMSRDYDIDVVTDRYEAAFRAVLERKK